MHVPENTLNEFWSIIDVIYFKNMNLSYCLTDFSEVCNQFPVILFVMDVEAVPQVAAEDDAAESEFLHQSHVVDIDTAECIHMLVDESLSGRLFQLFHSEIGILVGLALAVEDVLEEDVVGFLLGRLQLVYFHAGTREMPFVAFGQRRVGRFDVDASEPVFPFQVVMVVHGDFAVNVLGE